MKPNKTEKHKTGETVVVDAADQVLGRVCSRVAKQLLKGENVVVVNAERAVVTGRPDLVYRVYLEKRWRGDPHHGPYYPTLPEAILRRSVRGMLPYKKPKGREALRRLRVHAGNPQNLRGERVAKNSSQLTHKYVTLSDISKQLRGGSVV